MIQIAEYNKFIDDNFYVIQRIRRHASHLHDVEVNQLYGNGHPYSYHLKMVAQYALQYAYLVCEDIGHVIPVIFGAYFHDAIEDARKTYHDILTLAKTFMSEEQAIMATEIVYALTDEKGRTRAERGSEKHYEDIRKTKYAPFVKFCDRYANLLYSIENGSRMANVYKKEMPDFIKKIGNDLYVPSKLVNLIEKICNNKLY